MGMWENRCKHVRERRSSLTSLGFLSFQDVLWAAQRRPLARQYPHHMRDICLICSACGFEAHVQRKHVVHIFSIFWWRGLRADALACIHSSARRVGFRVAVAQGRAVQEVDVDCFCLSLKSQTSTRPRALWPPTALAALVSHRRRKKTQQQTYGRHVRNVEVEGGEEEPRRPSFSRTGLSSNGLILNQLLIPACRCRCQG